MLPIWGGFKNKVIFLRGLCVFDIYILPTCIQSEVCHRYFLGLVERGYYHLFLRQVVTPCGIVNILSDRELFFTLKFSYFSMGRKTLNIPNTVWLPCLSREKKVCCFVQEDWYTKKKLNVYSPQNIKSYLLFEQPSYIIPSILTSWDIKVTSFWHSS